MIKKVAGTSQDIKTVLDITVSKLFSSLSKANKAAEVADKPSFGGKSDKGEKSELIWLAQTKAEKAVNIWANYAVAGLEHLLSRVDDISKITYADVTMLFGTKSPEKVFEQAMQVAGILSGMNPDEYLATLEDITNFFKARKRFVVAGGDSVLSKILELKTSKQKTDTVPEQQEETHYDEPVPEPSVAPEADSTTTSTVDANDSWYVSAELNPDSMFHQGTIFYGPFITKITAAVFSLIVNNSSGQDRSVANGSRIAKTTKIDLSFATAPGSAIIGNHYFAGEIDTAMASYLSTKKKSNLMINISPSGELFRYLVEFVSINCPFVDPANPQISEIKEWYKDKENGVAKFPEFYLLMKGTKKPLGGSSKDLNALDPAIHGGATDNKPKKRKFKRGDAESIPDSTKTTEVKDTAASPEILGQSILSASVEQISIFSDQNPDVLNNSLAIKYVEELRQSLKNLTSIDTTQIMQSVDGCIAQLDLFFKSVMHKDNSLRQQIQEFRKTNPLNISTISPDWEFRANFSVSNMIANDKDIVAELSNFIGKVAYYKRLVRTDPSISKIVGFKIREYQNRTGRESFSKEEVEEVTTHISTVINSDMLARVPRILSNKLSKKFEHNIYSAINVDNFTESIIVAINVDSIVRRRISSYFSSKETISKEVTVRMVKCGVCDQVFSVPKEHIRALNKFDKDVENYSFFRADNSLITEDELIGDMASQKSYRLDVSTMKMLSSDAASLGRLIRRTMGGKETVGVSQNIQTAFTWLEVNKMIYNPSGIKDQIDGQMIRNFILKSLGATPSGARGVFSNKTLCASTLYNLTEDMKVTNKEFIESNDNYACRASSMATYDAVPTAKSYQASSYIMPFGNAMRSTTTEKYPNRLGYMFSRNNVRCPCHIDAESTIIPDILKAGRKSYQGLINFVAIPKLPQSALASLDASLLFKESDLYSAPTNPDGELKTELPAAYVICGRNTSLSMFDRDPSSRNYIQSFFRDMLSYGKESLISAVKLMLNYGVEMNDIKPHLEAVLGEQNVSFASRRDILQSLLKVSTRIVTAQEVLESDARVLQNLGMVCEHGHKFTLRQSWDFASTHFAIKLVSDKLLKIKALDDIVKNPFKSMIDSDRIAVFKIVADEAQLRNDGFKQSAEVSSLSELKQLMNDKRLYFKSDDGAIYIISDPRFLSLDNAPWISGKINKEQQFTHNFVQHSTMSSQTKDTEDGGRAEADVEDEEALFGVELLSKNREERQESDLSFAEMIMPDITANVKDSLIKDAQGIYPGRLLEFEAASKLFVDSLIRTLKLSRSWGIMAADYQIDFMRGSHVPLIRDPDLKRNISAVLDSISGLVDLETADYEADFYSKYDVDSLISESAEVDHDKFLSLATVAQYYEGFSVPFIANMKAAEARLALIAALKTALVKSLPILLSLKSGKRADAALPIFDSAAEQLAVLLLSPYDNIFALDPRSGKSANFNYLMEKAVAEYTGRAYVFSFAIDMMDKMNTFFSRYFFNEESSLYIGPFSNSDRSSMSLMNDMFKTVQVGTVSVANLLIMDESDFKTKMSELRLALNSIYKIDGLFESYINHKKIIIGETENKVFAQKAVVALRFSKLFTSATNSISCIIQDLSEKPLNSPSLKVAAIALDNTTNALMMRRDPLNYNKIKERMDKTASRYEDKDYIFEQNAVGFARINLSPLNIGLSQIAYLEKSVRAIDMKPAALLPEFFDMKGISGAPLSVPYIYFVKKIVVYKQTGAARHAQGRAEGNKEFYICAIPNDPAELLKTDIGNIDLMDYINFDNTSIIRLDNKHGKEFIARYIRGVDQSQKIILVDPSFLELTTKGHKISGQNIVDLVLDPSLKIGKMYNPIRSWPPPNNLIYNNYDIARNPSTTMIGKVTFDVNLQHRDSVQDANKYYAENTNIENHTDFMANVTSFPVSIGSKTVDVSSTHGVLIPLSSGNPKQGTSSVTNTIVQDNSKIRTDSFSISKADIKVRTGSGTVLNMAWAFKGLDPQFYDEDGKIRSRLVQSGSVQKLEYILSKMKYIYGWIEKNAKYVLEELLDQSFNSFDQFLSAFFSSSSQCVHIVANPDMSIKSASLSASVDKVTSLIIMRDDPSPIVISRKTTELMTNLIRLVDLFNAAQILNAEYLKLKPQITDVNSINIDTKEEFKSLSLTLLDPLSLWKIVTNPMMSSSFGGPIDPEDVNDYKTFIVATFGIDDLLGRVCIDTGISPNDITVADMFDMPTFCDKYISKHSKDAAITSFINLFGLNQDDDGSIKTYINGYPMIFQQSVYLSETMASLEYKQFALHEASYVEHISRMSDKIPAADMKNPAKVAAFRGRHIALQNGTEVSTLDELIRFASKLRAEVKRYSPDSKDADSRRAGDFESLRLAVLDIAGRIYRGQKSVKKVEAQKSLSWRKIAQGESDEEGSIDLRGLYDELQQRFLNAMAEMAS